MKNYRYIVAFWLLVFATNARADEVQPPQPIGLPGESVDSWQEATGILSIITEKGIDVAAMIAIIGIGVVGIMFITAEDKEERRKRAIKYTAMIAIGIVLAVSAYLIISLINTIPQTLQSL